MGFDRIVNAVATAEPPSVPPLDWRAACERVYVARNHRWKVEGPHREPDSIAVNPRTYAELTTTFRNEIRPGALLPEGRIGIFGIPVVPSTDVEPGRIELRWTEQV